MKQEKEFVKSADIQEKGKTGFLEGFRKKGKKVIAPIILFSALIS